MSIIDEPRFEKAYALHRENDLGGAIALYRELIEEGGGSPDLDHLYGLALHQAGDHAAARVRMEKAVASSPESIPYRQNLSIVYVALGDVEAAVGQLQEILKREPDHLETHQRLAFHLRNLRRHEGALHHGNRALELDPGHGATWNNVGNIHNDIGRIEEARRHYRKSAELTPRYGQAWANLSSVTRYGEADREELSRMKSILDSGGLSERDAGQICFALGKAHKDLGQAEEAFSWYEKANRSVASGFPWEKFESYLSGIREVYRGNLLAERETSGSEESPIFIVGMLRSGTSLLEQILSTHPRIAGVGERPELARLTERVRDYPRGAIHLDRDDLAKLAGEYTAAMNRFKEPGLRSADKMMTNFLHIGWISLLFPRARIIHLKRHPYATCLSIFFQNFARPPGWTSSLDDIGRYYAHYGSMMKHWEVHSPVEIHTVVYEELLSDPEGVTRELFARCGETWERGCLAFHQNRSVVQTASNWQVRQPLNRKNAEAWRAFAGFLDPLEKWVGPG